MIVRMYRNLHRGFQGWSNLERKTAGGGEVLSNILSMGRGESSHRDMVAKQSHSGEV
jgi:hypothetical protein